METLVEPRVKIGSGLNYYSRSPKSAQRMNRQMAGWAAAPRRIARDR
jgi:hypothetical protein